MINSRISYMTPAHRYINLDRILAYGLVRAEATEPKDRLLHGSKTTILVPATGTAGETSMFLMQGI